MCVGSRRERECLLQGSEPTMTCRPGTKKKDKNSSSFKRDKVRTLTTGWHALIPFNQFLERINLNIFIVNVVRSSRLRRLWVILSVEFFASGERKVKTRREAFEGILPTKNEHLFSAVAYVRIKYSALKVKIMQLKNALMQKFNEFPTRSSPGVKGPTLWMRWIR